MKNAGVKQDTLRRKSLRVLTGRTSSAGRMATEEDSEPGRLNWAVANKDTLHHLNFMGI